MCRVIQYNNNNNDKPTCVFNYRCNELKSKYFVDRIEPPRSKNHEATQSKNFTLGPDVILNTKRIKIG